MKTDRVLWLLILLLSASACEKNSGRSQADAESLLASVSATRVRADMITLSSDEMEGREAATAGHRKAAEFVARRFTDLSLEPLGDSGTFLQNIEFLESQIVPGSVALSLRRDDISLELEEGKDFVSYGGYGDAAERIVAPLVFIGFGIQAPGYNHDDFAGVDVNGKIVVVLSGAPPGFSTDERAFYSSGSGKRDRAALLGAVGIVTIQTPADQQRTPWSRIVDSASGSGMRWLERDGTPHDASPTLVGEAILSNSGASKLFELAGQNLDVVIERHNEGQTGSFELDVLANLQRQSNLRKVSSPNVVGLLRGSDPGLRNEYVLITAHLDHLGMRKDAEGDNIYNGAYDNAAGVAVVLAVAQALSEAKPLPRRSIIFAAVTAEEKGLRGSDYLANNPPAPITSIVANINIDMPYLGFPIADMQGFGADHSTLEESLNRAAAQLGLAVMADQRPDLVRLIRSDQFSFVRKGIPGMNLKPGTTSSSPEIDGTVLVESFLHNAYHRPSDDSNLQFNEQGAASFTSVAVLLVSSVANDTIRPEWKDGDFFGNRFRDGETD